MRNFIIFFSPKEGIVITSQKKPLAIAQVTFFGLDAAVIQVEYYICMLLGYIVAEHCIATRLPFLITEMRAFVVF